MIVLDTSVLSLVFRRRQAAEVEPRVAALLRRMVEDDWPLTVPGICLQELLSGIRATKQFRALQAHLEGFPVLLAEESHHVRAAQLVNTCRETGISCSTVDALIAAQTIAEQGQLFTTDQDFEALVPHCGLKLFSADTTTP